MEPFFEYAGRRFYQQVVHAPADFQPAFGGAPYPCLLWTHERPLPEDARQLVAAQLVATDCRYAVCAGVACEVLHDAVDDAFIEPYFVPSPTPIERPAVMTTWHTDEDYDEVAAFFVLNTNF